MDLVYFAKKVKISGDIQKSFDKDFLELPLRINNKQLTIIVKMYINSEEPELDEFIQYLLLKLNKQRIKEIGKEFEKYPKYAELINALK